MALHFATGLGSESVRASDRYSLLHIAAGFDSVAGMHVLLDLVANAESSDEKGCC